MVFLFSCFLYRFRIFIKSFFAVFFCPFECLLKFFFIVDSFFHAADQFYFVHRFHTHTEILFQKCSIDDGATNSHCHRSNLQIRSSTHRCHCYCTSPKSQKLLLDIFRNLARGGRLYFMPIDPKCWKTFLRVCCKDTCQIDCSWSLCPVKSPDCFYRFRIHVHCLGSITPTWCHSECNVNPLPAELILAGCRLCDTANCCISQNNLNRLSICIPEILTEKSCRCFCHAPCLLFQ